MSAESADTASSLEDYLDLLEVLSGLGVEFVVIGGCAVGAYARLLGEAVFSRDLDLFVTQRALEAVVADGAAIGVRIEKVHSPTKNDLGGYSILQGESKEALAETLKGHPHFMTPDGFIEIVELMSMPGM